jgi:hypothetical protein
MSKKILDNFDLRTKKPLDKRNVVNLLTDIDLPYDGLLTYQKSDLTYYQYKNNTFAPFNQGLPEVIADVETMQNDVIALTNKIKKLGYANVADYGAHSILEATYANFDSLPAFNLAVAYLVSIGGGILYVPDKYFLSAPLVISNIDIVIAGGSPQISQMFFNGNNGIVYSSTNQFTDSIQIENISIVTSSDNIGNGITITFPDNTGSPWENVYINNICISGTTSMIAYNGLSNNTQTTNNNWVSALVLNNCADSKVLNSTIRNHSGIGILATGSTTDVVIFNVNFYGCSVGFKKDGASEGIWIESCKGINVDNFINLNIGAVAQAGVYCVIKNCHCAYYLTAVSIIFMPQVLIEGCLFYKYGDVGGLHDVMTQNCDIVQILNNKFLVTTGLGRNNGVTINGGNYINVDNNFINEREVAIWITASTTGYVQIGKGNILGSANHTGILDSGANTVIDYAIQPKCKVTHSVSQNIGAGVPTALLFNTELFDTDTIHDTTTNSSRLTVKTKGIYSLNANVKFDGYAGGGRTIAIRKNGTTIIASNSFIDDAPIMVLSILDSAIVTDYYEVVVTQNTTVSIGATYVAGSTPRFSMFRLS